MKNKIIAFVGADRVGKSTAIRMLNTEAKAFAKTYIAHFSGPQPHHNSPIDQYTEKLLEVPADAEIIFCDRFGSEVCFYEDFRRHNRISEEWAQSIESWCMSRADVALVFIQADFDYIEDRHLEEIRAHHPDATPYFTHLRLEERRCEHESYYNYMRSYLSNHTLIPDHNIFHWRSENVNPISFSSVGNDKQTLSDFVRPT